DLRVQNNQSTPSRTMTVNKNGDVVGSSDMPGNGGQIWIGASDGKGQFNNPKVIVPRQSGVTSYYPAITGDDQWVVFNQSSCSGPKGPPPAHIYYGADSCDGYDDASAQLRLVPAAGGSVVPLANANGSTSNWANSWPRFSPTAGTFRGKPLY